MRKLLSLFLIIAVGACDEIPKQRMVLEYGLHYPDTTIVKKHYFYGNEKAEAYIGISGGCLKQRYNYIQLYSTGVPGIPFEGIRSIVPIDIIDIYPDKTK